MKRILYTVLCVVVGLIAPAWLNAQPVANFSANVTSGCSPIVIQFTDLSTGGPTGWSWTLGNGTTSTLQNPSTTYITAGTYTVTLTVTSSSGSNTKTVTNYITVLPSPVVSFYVNDSSATCPPKTVQFTNTSIGSGTGSPTYLWDFGDGNTSTLANPFHTYLTNGNYNVTLVVTNANGCSKTLTKTGYIPVVAKPHADFTGLNTTGCTTPTTVTFTNASTGSTTYNWDFGDGGTSASVNPGHTYSATGNYNITLIATNGSGCSDTIKKNNFVTIGTLHAAFTKSASTICAGASVTFTNTSTPTGAANTWDFGDGFTSSNTNPVHTFTTPGTYNVKLVETSGTCKDSTTQTVTVSTSPVASFTSGPNTNCSAPFTVAFTNTSTNAATYTWRFGDGSTSNSASPSHTYNSIGTFTVTLVAVNANGCTDSIVSAAYVIISAPAGFINASPPGVCLGTPVLFTCGVVGNPGITGTLNFGDGSATVSGNSATHVYSAVGLFTASYTFTASGCTLSVTTSVGVSDPPIPDFIPSRLSICPGQSITFTNTSTGATSYLWDFGGGGNEGTSSATSPTHTFNNSGSYTITLTAYNGYCTRIFKDTIIVNPPDAKFTETYNCTDRLQVAFTDQSSGAINTYAWTFGDGQTSTTQNPVHTYAAYGNYTVVLHVTNTPSGCTATNTVTVSLFPLTPGPINASDSNICKNDSITFSTPSNANYVVYTWNFGDGFTSANATRVSHTYTTAGIYSVKLVVRDIHGCTDSLTKLNYIHVGGPSAGFYGTPVSGCNPLTVTFHDTSTAGGNAINTWKWYFGDGTIASFSGSLGAVSHTYLNAGTYTVSLVATDAIGCKDSVAKVNYITTSKPHAAFTTTDTNICKGATVHLTNTSTGVNPAYNWSFGDNTTSTLQSPTHIYNTGGIYTITLTVTDAGGCKDSMVRSALVHVNGVTASFTLSDTLSICPPLTVTTTNTSVNAVSYTWTFGNGNVSTLASPTVVYTRPGTYVITLVARNSLGCLDSMKKNVVVQGPYGTLNPTATQGCLPLTVTLSLSNSSATTYTWDMNNGFTQTTTTPSYTYTYTTGGKYVPVVVLSNGTCQIPIVGDTITVDNVVGDFSSPIANTCQGATIPFTDTVLVGSNVNFRSWSFGDGGTSSIHNPTHTYATAGSFAVQLIIGDLNGCKDTIQKTVTINPAPALATGPNPSFCKGQTTGVTISASGAYSYSWSPAVSLSCTTCPGPTALPDTTTTYTVVGTDPNGCADTGHVTVTVNPKPVVGVSPDQVICSGSSVTLTASGAANYFWLPVTGLSCSNCATTVASPPVTTAYTVIGISVFNCRDTGHVTVTVNPIPIVNAGSNRSVCAGDTVQLQGTGTGVITYRWYPAAGLSCTACTNPVAAPFATTTYSLVGTNASNCNDTSRVTVTVHPLPVISAGPNKNVCLGSSVVLTATGGVSYTWSPATGLSCVNCAQPTVTPVSTITYTISGTDANGCPGTGTIKITVKPLPVVTATGGATICVGAHAQLNASGAVTYTWTSGLSLTCNTCPNPIAGPHFTTTYIVTGTDSNGCSDTAMVTVTVLPKPSLSAADQAICKGGSVQLHATGGVSYVWVASPTLSCLNCPDPFANPAVNTTYFFSGTGANGCSDTSHVNVNIFPPPVVTVTASQVLCAGSSLQLTASGAKTYVWSPAAGLSCTACPDPVASPVVSTNYTVISTDSNGCKDTNEVAVTVLNKIHTAVGPDTTICRGASVPLYASGGMSYTWVPATGLDNSHAASPVATPDVTTNYMVIIKENQCFSDTAYEKVVVKPVPTVSLGSNQVLLSTGSITLFASVTTNIIRYEWTPVEGLSCDNCQSPDAAPKRTTTYTVTVTNDVGCKASASITIDVICDKSKVFIPNTFTPNGDGWNDRFFASGKGLSIIQRFSVYSRWGELIYDIQNIPLNEPQYGWDGTFKGQQLKPDVFVYVIEAICETDDPVLFKGDISLIR